MSRPCCEVVTAVLPAVPSHWVLRAPRTSPATRTRLTPSPSIPAGTGRQPDRRLRDSLRPALRVARPGLGTLPVEADVPARLSVPELRAFGRVHVAVHRPGIHRDHALTNPPASDSISLTNVYVTLPICNGAIPPAAPPFRILRGEHGGQCLRKHTSSSRLGDQAEGAAMSVLVPPLIIRSGEQFTAAGTRLRSGGVADPDALTRCRPLEPKLPTPSNRRSPLCAPR
jgi:hypothetical protein